jgi:cytoskeletal protein CcmA (bactofilin family)
VWNKISYSVAYGKNHPMPIFSSNRKSEPAAPARGSETSTAAPEPPDRAAIVSSSAGVLSRGVSIKGSVKFCNELLIDGEVEGEISSTGILTIGEHARIRGEIKAKSVQVLGTVDGNIFATERCKLQAGCTVRGDVEAPRLVVDENAAFLGSAKIAPQK